MLSIKAFNYRKFNHELKIKLSVREIVVEPNTYIVTKIAAFASLTVQIHMTHCIKSSFTCQLYLAVDFFC